MIQTKLILSGKKNIEKRLLCAQNYIRKSLLTAVRIESFRLREGLQKDIRAGKSGSVMFDPLSTLAKLTGGKSNFFRSEKKPLTQIAHGVRVSTLKKYPATVAIGYTKDTSKSYTRLAQKHNRGFSTITTQKQRRYLSRRGGTGIGRKAVFFIKTTTRAMVTPPRKLAKPYFNEQKKHMAGNVRKNLKKQLKRGKL